MVQKAQPDKLESMRRKSFYILENTINQIKTDDTMYREKQDGSTPGLSNTEKVTINGKTYEGKTKFCELYANALTKRANTKTNCTPNAKTFTTADNVDWYLPVTDFKEGYAPIKFDVNGKAEPNCEYSNNCKHPDTFTYYLLPNGKLTENIPTINGLTYCIKTTITGQGTVSPSPDYCGLTNGTYTLTSLPKIGWTSNWSNNEKRVKIKNSDATAEVTFTELPKACIKLNVTCETGLPNNCGSYAITNGTFTQSGNTLTACNLPANTYTIRVTPKTNFTSTWQTQDIALNGIDQTIDVAITENKYCAKLSVSCPDGGANVCGSYTINGNGTSYGMDASGNNASTCALKNGSYTLNVTSTGYKPDKPSQSFTIANRDWNGSVGFKKKGQCKLNNYFVAGGKKWTCAFEPQPMTKADCEAQKDDLGIKECFYNDDYWAGAVKQCGGIDKMPTMEDLNKILQASAQIYDYFITLEDEYGAANPDFVLWSGQENSDFSAYARGIGSKVATYHYSSYRNTSPIQFFAVCLIE